MTNRFRYQMMGAMLLASATLIPAADLKPATIEQWDEYVKAVDARHQERMASGLPFLSSDEVAGQTVKLRAGEIIVAPAGPHVPLKVTSGLIHDWNGAAFIPNATLNEVLPVIRDYDRYKEFYQPTVLESKSIATAETKDQFSMVIMNKSVVAKTALDSDYQSVYTRVDEHRWYTVSDTTRIQEIADYDAPSQHMLPENHGTGLIWRLHSITRFEERDGGVYIEVQAVVLSRDIPMALHWMIDPIVRRVSRSSVATSLRQTEIAVQLHSAAAMTSTSGSARGAQKTTATGLVRSFH